MYLLTIKGDANDADYIEETTELESLDDDFLSLLKRVNTAIDNCKENYNWPNHDYTDRGPKDIYKNVLSEQDIDWFNDYVPRGEYGIHSVVGIKLYKVEEISLC